jgi:hypothetical protein
MKSPRLIAVVLLCTPLLAFSQTIVIKKVELAGAQVIVHYELDDGNPNNEYLISLYSSKDNYATALTKVSGDVGMEVKPGPDKEIVWDIIAEYGGYKGKIALEVKCKVYVPFVKLAPINPKQKFSRGKTYPIKWKPGNSNPVNIELYNGGERVSGELNHPNNGSFNLFIPKHAKAGNEYRLKISDPRNSEEVIYSPYFKVGPAIPLWLKIAPVVVAGVVVGILVSGDDGGNGNTDPTVEVLPAAPDPE